MTFTIRALAVPLLVALTNAQDAIYYKFTAGAGNKVINYGTGDPTAPREGTIMHNPQRPLAKAWGTGRFGLGLAAGPSTRHGYHVNTGWATRVSSNATISFFIKMAYALPTNGGGTLLRQSSLNGIGMSMSGITSTLGWLTLNWGGSSPRSTLQRDIYSLATSRWVHIAVVVDRLRNRLIWYVDGKPELPRTIQNWKELRSIEDLSVGNQNDGYWHLDEVRVSLRAVPATEIAAWASAEPAAHAPFEKPCHPVGRAVLLDGSGGLPKIGNSGYALTVYGLPQSVVALGLGSNNQMFSGVPLPLDLKILDPQLSGCFLRTSAELIAFGTIGPTGALSFSLPIPNLPGASGVKLYSQAILASSILNATMLTNAWATVVGK